MLTKQRWVGGQLDCIRIRAVGGAEGKVRQGARGGSGARGARRAGRRAGRRRQTPAQLSACRRTRAVDQEGEAELRLRLSLDLRLGAPNLRRCCRRRRGVAGQRLARLVRSARGGAGRAGGAAGATGRRHKQLVDCGRQGVAPEEREGAAGSASVQAARRAVLASPPSVTRAARHGTLRSPDASTSCGEGLHHGSASLSAVCRDPNSAFHDPARLQGAAAAGSACACGHCHRRRAVGWIRRSGARASGTEQQRAGAPGGGLLQRAGGAVDSLPLAPPQPAVLQGAAVAGAPYVGTSCSCCRACVRRARAPAAGVWTRAPPPAVPQQRRLRSQAPHAGTRRPCRLVARCKLARGRQETPPGGQASGVLPAVPRASPTCQALLDHSPAAAAPPLTAASGLRVVQHSSATRSEKSRPGVLRHASSRSVGRDSSGQALGAPSGERAAASPAARGVGGPSSARRLLVRVGVPMV